MNFDYRSRGIGIMGVVCTLNNLGSSLLVTLPPMPWVDQFLPEDRSLDGIKMNWI
jgi:hypothetical protein